jgi:molybdopterin molybdotransferase
MDERLPMTPHDCFAVDQALLPVAAALALIAERVAPVVSAETLPLAHCLGRVLAEPIIATAAQPPFANAAMDGYAVRFADLAMHGRHLPVAARVGAGHPVTVPLPPGCAVQIFTGAPLPPGFDTVVMQEDCGSDDRGVLLPDGCRAGSHVRQAGIDFKPGDILVAAGRRLRPQDIGISAALGRVSLPVLRRLKVGLFSTGDELVAPGQPLAPGQIYDSNRPMLLAALQTMGFEVHDLGQLADNRDQLVTAFALAALDFDALVSTGGVSVGGEDHVRAALEQLGQLHFWRLAVKPGKPLALGTIGKATFIGLPGNPVSSLISLLVIGRAVLHRLAGAPFEAALPAPMLVPAASPVAQAENRLTYLRGRLVEADGMITALPYFSQDSSLISSLVGSDGLIEIGAGVGPLAAGTPVLFRPYVSLLC